jgi:hypothetical protein
MSVFAADSPLLGTWRMTRLPLATYPHQATGSTRRSTSPIQFKIFQLGQIRTYLLNQPKRDDVSVSSLKTTCQHRSFPGILFRKHSGLFSPEI